MKSYNFIIFFILVLGIFAVFFVQFLTPTLYGADGYLHIRMAEFLKAYGPRYDFHWARLSTFNGNFADKDFLYHIFLIPFTLFGNIFFGAKLAAAIFACLLFLTYYSILRRYCHKALLPFFLIAFFLSDLFLQAISRPRPIALVVLITLVSIRLLIEKRYRWIFVISLLYSLGHITSPLIVFYAVIVEAVRFTYKRDFYARTIIAALLGILTGFIIHPNFPNNFLVFYLNSILVPVYTFKTGVLELGAEFFPLNTRQVLLSYPAIIIGLIVQLYIAVSKRPRVSFQTSSLLTLSAVFLILAFICRRYLMHGYLIMLLGFSSYFSDYLSEAKLISRKAIGVICLLLLILGFNSYKGVRYNALVARIINGHYEQVGKWMEKNIPAGELVFHANWSDSQYFIGLNPKDDYFVTLDPVYMYKWNPELYRLYRNVAFGRTRDPYAVLKDTFKVKYGYIGKNYFKALIDQLRVDSRFKILAEDNLGLIFEII